MKRTWAPKNINDVLFPVEVRPVLYVDNNGHTKFIPQSKAIVDPRTSYTFAVVSRSYRLITNREAYEIADYIIRGVFPGLTLKDFVVFNIYMPRTKGSCRIDLIKPHTFENPFGDETDQWTPFVRITNSYNKTFLLKYEIGFCRWICLNGVIFGQKGVTVAFNHTEITKKDLDEIIEKAIKQIGNIRNLWSAFEKKLKRLKDITIPESLALAMFCKAFGIVIKDEKKLKPNQIESLGIKAKQIVRISKDYFDELGNNAYAIFNVLTDFASFPEGTTNFNNYVHSYQRKVGDWVDDLIKEYDKEGYSHYKYIGEDAMNTAFILEALIKREKEN